MLLYLSAQTNIPDVYVDYIEVELNTGERVSLNWDESDISRSKEGFDARYKGVYFGEEYADGRIHELENCKITDVSLYYETEGTFYFRIEEMLFEDSEHSLSISNPYVPPAAINIDPPTPKPLSDQIHGAASRNAKPTNHENKEGKEVPYAR